MASHSHRHHHNNSSVIAIISDSNNEPCACHSHSHSLCHSHSSKRIHTKTVVNIELLSVFCFTCHTHSIVILQPSFTPVVSQMQMRQPILYHNCMLEYDIFNYKQVYVAACMNAACTTVGHRKVQANRNKGQVLAQRQKQSE